LQEKYTAQRRGSERDRAERCTRSNAVGHRHTTHHRAPQRIR
jgi:hypothetical protein